LPAVFILPRILLKAEKKGQHDNFVTCREQHLLETRASLRSVESPPSNSQRALGPPQFQGRLGKEFTYTNQKGKRKQEVFARKLGNRAAQVNQNFLGAMKGSVLAETQKPGQGRKEE